MKRNSLGLREKILIAAVEGVGADTTKSFTIEDLAVWAWQRDPQAWGLRGYEITHPDLDKVRKDMGARGAEQKGVVQLGWVERQEPRVYRLTPSGLAAYNDFVDAAPFIQEKIGRELESEIRRILEHPVFHDWLKDHSRPRHFREAGHFWGIAPGTPARTVQERLQRVDDVLKSAFNTLERRGVDAIAASHGRALFDRSDIERSLEFQKTLKSRFAHDLSILAPAVVL